MYVTAIFEEGTIDNAMLVPQAALWQPVRDDMLFSCWKKPPETMVLFG